MLANIRQENPAKRVFSVATTQEMGADDLTAFFPVLFQKHDVAPGRRAEVARVVVGISRPSEAVIGHLVPFLARDLASLAADANGRVGKKSYFDVIAHVGVFPLIRAMSALADHKSGACLWLARCLNRNRDGRATFSPIIDCRSFLPSRDRRRLWRKAHLPLAVRGVN